MEATITCGSTHIFSLCLSRYHRLTATQYSSSQSMVDSDSKHIVLSASLFQYLTVKCIDAYLLEAKLLPSLN